VPGSLRLKVLSNGIVSIDERVSRPADRPPGGHRVCCIG
jgi:hypothetical protein